MQQQRRNDDEQRRRREDLDHPWFEEPEQWQKPVSTVPPPPASVNEVELDLDHPWFA